MPVELALLGTLFVVAAISIALRQRCANHCTKHRRDVGIAAWLLAAASALAGARLIFRAIVA